MILSAIANASPAVSFSEDPRPAPSVGALSAESEAHGESGVHASSPGCASKLLKNACQHVLFKNMKFPRPGLCQKLWTLCVGSCPSQSRQRTPVGPVICLYSPSPRTEAPVSPGEANQQAPSPGHGAEATGGTSLSLTLQVGPGGAQTSCSTCRVHGDAAGWRTEHRGEAWGELSHPAGQGSPRAPESGQPARRSLDCRKRSVRTPPPGRHLSRTSCPRAPPFPDAGLHREELWRAPSLSSCQPRICNHWRGAGREAVVEPARARP